jgi:hypothetical protein
VITPGRLDTDLRQASSNAAFRCLLEKTSTSGYRLEGTGTSTYDSGFVSYVLTNLIDSDIAHALVRSHGLSEPASARAFAAAQVESAFATELSDTSCASPSTDVVRQLGSSLSGSFVDLQLDQDALAAYDSNVPLTTAGLEAYERAHPSSTTEACLSGVFAKSKATASTIEAALKSGKSLASVLAKYSPSQSSSKGVLGCYTASTLAGISSAIEAATAQAPIGAISAPVSYQGSYLVLIVTSRPFEPIIDALDAMFTTEATRVSNQIASAVGHTAVQVNPQYGTWRATKTSSSSSGLGGIVRPNQAPPDSDLLNAGAVHGRLQTAPAAG